MKKTLLKIVVYQ